MRAAACADQTVPSKAGRHRRPLGLDLEKMLRIYFRRHWFNLSDPQAEDADLRQRIDEAFRTSGVG